MSDSNPYTYTTGDKLTILNASNPPNSEVVKYWAAALRYLKAGLLEWAGTEHNLDGTHKAGFISASMIASGAVTGAKLANGAVGTVNITDANVTTAKIADGAVTTAKIASGAVDTAQLSAGVQGQLGVADGQMYLWVAPGTQASQTASSSSNQTAFSYSYTPPATSDGVIVECDVQFQCSGTLRVGTFVLSIGSYTQQFIISTQANNNAYLLARLAFNAPQTTSATIKLQHTWNTTDASVVITVLGYRVIVVK